MQKYYVSNGSTARLPRERYYRAFYPHPRVITTSTHYRGNTAHFLLITLGITAVTADIQR